MAGHQVWIVPARRVASGELGIDGGFVEVGQSPSDPRRFVLAEEESEAFFDGPRGLDLLGRVAGVEGSPQPGPLLAGQVFGTGQQHVPVEPDRVGGGAAAAEQVAGDALPDLGDHGVRQRDEVPLVDRDLHSGQSGPDSGRVRRGRVDHDDLDPASGTRRTGRPASRGHSCRCGPVRGRAADRDGQGCSRRSWSSTDPTVASWCRPGSTAPTGTGSRRSRAPLSAPVRAATGPPRRSAPCAPSATTRCTRRPRRRRPDCSWRSPSRPCSGAARSAGLAVGPRQRFG